MSKTEFSTSQAPLITRRGFLSLGLSATTLASTVPLAWLESACASKGSPLAQLTSLEKAYVFLGQMMDVHGQGQTIRLLQSYLPAAALDLGDTGFTYDNAVALIAFLLRGHAKDIERATVLGNSLVYGQQHDPAFVDGRLRDAYHVHPYVVSNGQTNVNPSFAGSMTGNIAWAGLALGHLYSHTKQKQYLDGAVRLGTWIQQNVYDSRGAGGYKGGFAADQSPLLWKAMEHNIDVYAFFTMLASLTHSKIWSVGARHAQLFVQAMWNSTGKHFWTGTTTDGVTINRNPIPEDVQAWSYLAMRDALPAVSIDWTKMRLAATDGSFSGVSFSNTDTSGVWFEGTAHLAAALLLRNAQGDSATATTYLQSIQLAQLHAPNNNQMGIVAASHDGLQTGFGFSYYAALHVGATAWYCIAKQKGNPFQL